MGAELAASGLPGPPTFPLTTLSFRLKNQKNPALCFQAVVADGVSGNPNDPGKYTLKLQKEEEAFLAAGIILYRFESGSSESDTGVETRTNRKHIGREVATDYKWGWPTTMRAFLIFTAAPGWFIPGCFRAGIRIRRD